MTNVKFPRKEFEKHVKLTPEIQEKISLFGTPLESINEKEVEIEIFPNRPDLLSFHLYVKSFLSFLGKNSGLRTYKTKKPEKDYKIKIEPSVKNVRPFTSCAIVKGLKFDDQKIKEIIDLQEKLHITIGRNRKKVALGIYPLEKITLPITYKALSPEKIKFIPLEYDRELNGLQILRKHPAGRTYEHLLAHENKFPIFVDAKKEILSMPPIINSEKTGRITTKTKDVFIECSGSDFKTLSKTLNIIVATLAEMDGKIFQMTLNYVNKKIITPSLVPEKMRISLDNVNKLLGTKIKESDLEKLLPKMGFNYKNKTVIISPLRTDILHEVDLIEDIAIAYGYENFKPEIPNIYTIAEESSNSKMKNKLSQILIGLGFIETSTYHLIKQNETKLSESEKIELENSKTDYKLLRPNLLIPSLRILAENKDHDYPQKTFEIGTVFSPDRSNKEETGIKENTHLIALASPANFTKIKQVLDRITSLFNIEYELKENSIHGFIDGRTAEIIINNKNSGLDNRRVGGWDNHSPTRGKLIGYIGELHPETLRAWTIKMPVAVLEISLDGIFKNN